MSSHLALPPTPRAPIGLPEADLPGEAALAGSGLASQNSSAGVYSPPRSCGCQSRRSNQADGSFGDCAGVSLASRMHASARPRYLALSLRSLDSLRRWRRVLLAGAAAALVVGCHSGNTCSGGALCECSGGDDCYIDCGDTDCNLRFHDIVHAGGICGDGCRQECFAVTDCSLSCGDGCDSSTHDVTSSGTECGDDCHHECFGMSRCGVMAGARSDISCHNVTTCEIAPLGADSVVRCDADSTCTVECLGTCRVQFTMARDSVHLSCPPEAPRVECSPTLIACGAC